MCAFCNIVDGAERHLLPNLARTSNFRSCNNSYRYERLSGPYKIVDETAVRDPKPPFCGTGTDKGPGTTLNRASSLPKTQAKLIEAFRPLPTACPCHVRQCGRGSADPCRRDASAEGSDRLSDKMPAFLPGIATHIRIMAPLASAAYELSSQFRQCSQ
jgi:hypothetical protein